MIRRHWPALSIAMAVLAAGLNLQAQPATPAPAATPAADVGLKELVARQQNLERQYKSFTTNLLALAQKLEKSDRIEDKDKAKALRKAIDMADKEGVDNKFTKLLSTLTGKSGLDLSVAELTSAANQNDELIKALRDILAILQSDDELDRIKAEKKLLEQMLAELNSLIRATNINQARADSGKGDPKQLAKDQDKLAGKVDDLAAKLGSPKPGGGKESEPKGGSKSPPKEGEEQGEEKEDSKGPKGDEKAPGDKADPMKGDGAAGKPSKGGPPMDGAAGKPGGPPKDGGDSKPMGDPKKDQAAEKRNKEDNKGDDKGSASASSPMPPPKDAQASSKSQGSPSGSPSGQPKPGSGNPSASPPPPPAAKLPGADQVRKAVPDEQNAAGNLDQDKRPKASEDLTKADEALRQAREELEKRLKQLREQELERLLANLEQRVNKMLQWQIEVKSATVAIHTQVQKHPEKKAQPVDFQNAQKQEDKEAEIISEADKAIQLLQNEGSAVAFPAVFEEVRKDMMRVKERLHEANVGDDTQAMEQEIIEALTHMRDALKKAQQELGKTPPPPPSGPQSDQPQLQKLLDEIAELKMIRQLQTQVNDRTKRYGNKTPGAEQSDDGQIKKELKDLGDRQEKIETMVNNIATKKNQ